MNVLILEDKLGITPGYQPIWVKMCIEAGFQRHVQMTRMSLSKELAKEGKQAADAYMVKYRTRKQPTFNPALREFLYQKVSNKCKELNASMVLCQDAGALGLVESSQANATIDNLRGGVYLFHKQIPFIVITPVSAVNTSQQAKDIQLLNAGAMDEETWDAEVSDASKDSMFIMPYYIPSGRWILASDLAKAARILNNGH